MRRRLLAVGREGRRDALQVEKESFAGGLLLLRRVSQRREVGAHRRRVGVAGLAGVRLELVDCRLEAAKHHRGREWGEDDVEAHPGGHPHRRLAEAGHVDGRVRLLDRAWVDRDRVRDGVVLAGKGELVLGPGGADQF